MFVVLHALGMFVVDLFESRSRPEGENLFLRHQLAIALRRAPSRFRLHGSDRALLIWMTRLWPSLIGAVQVVQPETILRWHRAGFKVFWRWKSRNGGAVGRIADPWRASDAWLIDGLEIHGALSESAVANLEDISSKSR